MKLTVHFFGKNEEHKNLGLFDNKGRIVGVKIKTWSAAVAEAPESTYAGYMSPRGVITGPGSYLAASVHVTRNGGMYGATQPLVYFVNEADRQAWINRQVKKMTTYNAKKFAAFNVAK